MFSVKDEENVSNNIVNTDNKNNELANGASVKNKCTIINKNEINFENIIK